MNTKSSGGGATTDAEIIIIGAGPVGLATANLLALRGVSVLVLEALPELIDYPRAVGLDDEGLRSIQTMGLVEKVLPHTTPQHIMRLVNGRGKVMAEIAPSTDEFGWSRRNAFVQPLVDRELYEGLARFDHVRVLFGTKVERVEDRGDRVVVTAGSSDGATRDYTAQYLVGAEGGRSATRGHIGVSFEGVSMPTRWIVIDIDDDPVGTPNIYLGADPKRPYVSIGLPHAIRRFEFMIFPNESDELVQSSEFVHRLLIPHLPDPKRIGELSRKRVFTHHARIAGAFRKGRIFIAGDAAHLMPVWQGQGYNSGLRDATNLAWKLAAVVKGQSDEALLDSYDAERRAHAKAMIDLSVAFGKVVKPTNRLVAGLRDAAAASMNLVPAIKQYFVQMKYKPMPRYTAGVVVDATTLTPGRSAGALEGKLSSVTTANSRVSPVGTQFPQPRVRTEHHGEILLDEVLGLGWSVLMWGLNPEQLFGDDDLARLERLGATLVSLRPSTQLHVDPPRDASTVVAADIDGRIKRWFDDRPTPVLFLRPDRFVAAAGIAQDAPAALSALFAAAHVRIDSLESSAVAPDQPSATAAGSDEPSVVVA